ncbi:MAG: hypothetical protein ACI9KE_005400 [Polyangiales bacterium]|jgi:hypothetical protein
MNKPPTVLEDAFERAGLVPHEKTYSRWTVTVSSEPRLRGSDQALNSKHRTCAACGSKDTRCVHKNGVSGREPWEEIELSCRKCAAFTQWRWEGW